MKLAIVAAHIAGHCSPMAGKSDGLLDAGEISVDSITILEPKNHQEAQELMQILLDHERLPDPDDSEDRVAEWVPDINEVSN